MKKILLAAGAALAMQTVTYAGPSIGISIGNGVGFAFNGGGTSIAIGTGSCYPSPRYYYTDPPVIGYYQPRPIPVTYYPPQQYIIKQNRYYYPCR